MLILIFFEEIINSIIIRKTIKIVRNQNFKIWCNGYKTSVKCFVVN